MKPYAAYLTAALAGLALAACAPQAQTPKIEAAQVGTEARIQQVMATRDFMAMLERLERVSWGIRAANVELCSANATYRPGMNVDGLETYRAEHREVVKEALGLGDRPTVMHAFPGGPASAAGLRKGDAIVAVQGVQTATRQQVLENANPSIAKGEPVTFTVERGGARQDLVVAPVKVCPYETFLRRSPDVNAYADGEHIVVMTGMMKFVRTDDELAAIIGHEMAHNSQEHLKAQKGNALIGALLFDLPVAILTGLRTNAGGNMGRNAFSQEFEAEADYVGLYFTARAGYNIANVPDIWRRMAVENPGAITLGSTHPSTSARFVALEAAAAEIDAKRKVGLELRPEMKEGKARKPDQPGAQVPK